MSYDPATYPNATTNRANEADLTLIQRIGALVPMDCELTVSSTSVTAQFKDGLGRNFRGYVSFKLRQVNTGLGTAQETDNGRIPATATTGSVLAVVTSTYNVDFITDANGAFACTLSGALTDSDKLQIENVARAYSHS